MLKIIIANIIIKFFQEQTLVNIVLSEKFVFTCVIKKINSDKTITILDKKGEEVNIGIEKISFIKNDLNKNVRY